jgi:multimeric flavodoxin WrbA
LIVHHSPTHRLRRLTDAVVEGANHPDIEGVEVDVKPALEATLEDALAADGYLLGTPANLGYMSGALKHFFDSTYDGCLEVTAGRPWGLWIHGSTDTTGARLAIEKVVTGLDWRLVAEPVELVGSEPDELERCFELGAVVAASTG